MCVIAKTYLLYKSSGVSRKGATYGCKNPKPISIVYLNMFLKITLNLIGV